MRRLRLKRKPRRLSPIGWMAVLVAVPLSVAAGPAVHDGGIWKAVVPAHPMAGAFNGLDPVGIASGARVQADCSINWVNPDDGIRYCFSSATSLVYFLDHPHAMIERARQRWAEMQTAK